MQTDPSIRYRVYVNKYGNVSRHLRESFDTLDEARAYALADERIQKHGGEIIRHVMMMDVVQTYGKEL